MGAAGRNGETGMEGIQDAEGSHHFGVIPESGNIGPFWTDGPSSGGDLWAWPAKIDAHAVRTAPTSLDDSGRGNGKACGLLLMIPFVASVAAFIYKWVTVV